MVLVTGACGHLGNTLIRELLDSGRRVRALVLPGESETSLDGLDVERVEGNVLVQEEVRRALEGVDTVFHLAGVISIRRGDDELMRRVNVDGTRTVALAAREAGVRKFVHVSSVHAIARPPMGTTIDESLPFDPDNPAGTYDRTKAEATLAVLDLVATGLPAVVVCPTGIVGPNDYLRSEMGQAVLRWSRPRRHFMIDGSFDFVDVRDVARGMIAAAERGRVGETYILGGNRVSLDELRKTVQRAAGVLKPAVRVPWRVALWGARLLGPLFRLAGKTSPYTPYSIETVRSNSDISHLKARQELGYSPRPLDLSIRDTVEWWRSRRPPARGSSWYGRTALVTGASSRAGEAIAARLASMGCVVVLVGRTRDRLERLASDIRTRGGKAVVAPADLSAPREIERLAAEIEARHGGVDVLVNNARVAWRGPFDAMPDETAHSMFSVNAVAAVELTRRFLPGMIRRGFGRVINIGSVVGHVASRGSAVYAATKAFIDAFSRSLGRELRGSGVEVSVVRPGVILPTFFVRSRAGFRHTGAPAERLNVSPGTVALRVTGLLGRPRPVAYVPRVLSALLPMLAFFFDRLAEAIGPMRPNLKLRRRVRA